MQINQETLDKWNAMKSHGDIRKIATESGYSYPTIFNAFKSGKASVKVYEAISKFFADREAMLNQYV